MPLQSVAQICTDIGRVGDPEELKGLLSRAADVLDASGLVLWLGTSSGSELRPALAHGYTPEMVSPHSGGASVREQRGRRRVPLRQSCRSCCREPARRPKAPSSRRVLSADGCVGVLSAEIRDGGEASETVQSLATIFAAQLAGVVASTPVAPRAQPAAGGAHSGHVPVTLSIASTWR